MKYFLQTLVPRFLNSTRSLSEMLRDELWRIFNYGYAKVFAHYNFP